MQVQLSFGQRPNVFLKRHGVAGQTILQLIRRHSDGEIFRQVAYLDWEIAQGKAIRNPGGRLTKMIREAWPLPPGAEAAYQRRFSAPARASPPALARASRIEADPPEEDPFGHLAPQDRSALRHQAEAIVGNRSPDLTGFRKEAQVVYHMHRLLAAS